MSGTSDPVFEFARIAAPSALVVLGWLVLYSNAKRIETRKEIRKLADIINQTIDEVASDARLYFSKQNTEYTGHLSNKIKTELSLISHYLFLMDGCGVKFLGSRDLVEFRKIVTGSYFETAQFMKQIEIPGWSAEFAASHAKLKLSVDRSYFKWTGAVSRKLLRTLLGAAAT